MCPPPFVDFFKLGILLKSAFLTFVLTINLLTFKLQHGGAVSKICNCILNLAIKPNPRQRLLGKETWDFKLIMSGGIFLWIVYVISHHLLGSYIGCVIQNIDCLQFTHVLITNVIDVHSQCNLRHMFFLCPLLYNFWSSYCRTVSIILGIHLQPCL